MQKFLSKDSESTMRLNTSLGNVADEILGSSFLRSGGDADASLSHFQGRRTSYETSNKVVNDFNTRLQFPIEGSEISKRGSHAFPSEM